MTEKQAQKIMEKTIINGTPHPNTLEYMEALEISIDILGADYTREQLKNWILCGKYPFLILKYWNPKTRQYEVDKDYDYNLTELDMMEDGWKIAFGEMMSEELGEVLNKFNYADKFHFADIKEKWGRLEIAHNGVPVGCDVEKILDKYSYLSENICHKCGKPDVPMTGYGYYIPSCKKCFITPPSYWREEEDQEKINKWIKERDEHWEECNKKNNKMADSYTVISWSKENGDQKTTYDISETANKIRAKWRTEHGKN